jgi:hypothetical protein
MKKQLLFSVAAFLFLLASCSKEESGNLSLKGTPEEDILKTGKSGKNYAVHLTGDQEVPPNASPAQGQAIFHLKNNGTELHYKLIVANISNVSAAHIHIAPAGTNGGVVAWLYPSAPPGILIPGKFQGVLAEGVITSANLVGSLVGEDLSVLIDHLNNSNAYVNVHTSQFPGGEIRGQF